MTDKLQETDQFFQDEGGFSYQPDKVITWLERNVPLPSEGNVLDLCCGDGVWSWGMGELRPRLELYGIDISEGGVNTAIDRLKSDSEHFQVADAESMQLFPDVEFDFIFARGLPFFNQHNMLQPGFLRLLEYWHRKLSPKGLFFSTYASNPRLMGSYTPPEETRLPLNKQPRKTPALDFSGGKFHHSVQTFLAPFWEAEGVEVHKYRFESTRHILTTRRADG